MENNYFLFSRLLYPLYKKINIYYKKIILIYIYKGNKPIGLKKIYPYV